MNPNPAAESLRADIAICGAGLVGATLACALARHGLRTVVIDRVDPAAMVALTFDGRASAVALASQKLLQAIGVWDHAKAQAGPIRQIRVSDNQSLFFLHYDHAEIGDEPLGYMLENRHLRVAIAAAMQPLETLTCIAPATVREVTQTVDNATVHLDDGRSITASLVIAAEGRGSKVRDDAGIGVTGWTYPQTAIVATIGHERSHDGIAHERFLPAGPFAILPLKGGHASSLVWTEREDAAPSYLAMNDEKFLSEISERVGGFLGKLHLIGPRFSHPLGLQFAEKYAEGRIVLVGDAAHGIHPIAGQGLNLGFRDVAALTEVIVEARNLGLDPAYGDGLDRYQRWRRADNLLMAGVTDILNRLFSNDAAPLRIARDLGLAAVNSAAPLKKLFMRHAMGTVGELPRLMRGQPLL